MQPAQKPEVKLRKNILIVDNNSEIELLLKEPLMKQAETAGVFPILVRARDGIDAALKSANQKFDMVIVDMDAPRIMDGDFVRNLHSARNTHAAELFVLSPDEFGELPDQLKRSSKFFKKPVSAEELIASLISAFNKDKAHHENPHPKHVVDVRIINAVIASTVNVLFQYGVSSVSMGKAESRSPQETLLGEISSVVEIKSQSFRGYLTISFDKESYLEVISAMLMEEQTEINEDNQEAVGEINNIIFGNAKKEIAAYGVELAVPKVIVGHNHKLAFVPGSAGMIVPFTTNKGKFYVTVVALPLS